jgi:hypothetical protein
MRDYGWAHGHKTLRVVGLKHLAPITTNPCSLDKASLGELKSFGSPAAEVVQVRAPPGRSDFLTRSGGRSGRAVVV